MDIHCCPADSAGHPTRPTTTTYERFGLCRQVLHPPGRRLWGIVQRGWPEQDNLWGIVLRSGHAELNISDEAPQRALSLRIAHAQVALPVVWAEREDLRAGHFYVS